MIRRSWTFLLVAVTAVAMTACEGPEGPTGPAGPAGPTGPAGPAGATGPAGQDANENCTQCHAGDVNLYTKQQQILVAAHGPGMYIRDSGECTVCHTHQGFLERLVTGEWGYSAGSVDDVAPMNCRTCHKIHTTYTAADYELTAEGIPVSFRVAAQDVDFGNAANLCASCHQSRLRDGQMAVIDGDDVTFTSTHYGPHYATQGDMFAGLGFYDFEGGNGGQHVHGMVEKGCPACHMAEGSLTSGGHTFEMGSNVKGCQECHSSVEDFGAFGLQDDVQALLDELGPLIEASGVGHFSDGEWHPVPGTYPANAVAAWWNFNGVMNDGSLGIHNPPYIKALLQGSIDALSGS